MHLSLSVTRDRILVPIADQVLDAAPALELVGDSIRDRNARVFATEGGGQWPALAPATSRAKGSGRILVENGGLLDSFTKANARGARHKVTADSVTVVSTLVSGAMAEKGAHGAPVRDPSPPVTDRETAEWAQIIVGRLTDPRR